MPLQTENELISVIIPIYKTEAYLEQCVRSVLDQTHRMIEVILVDDGSPDRAGAMCDEWALRDERVRVIHQENQGLSAARNAGLEVCRGQWVMFVDSDDWVEPTFCEVPLSLALQHGADIVCFDMDMVNQDGSPFEKGNLYPLTASGLMTREETLLALSKLQIFEYSWNKLWRKSLFDGLRFPVGEVYEDQVITYKLVLRANTTFAHQEALYHYRQRPDSIVYTITSDDDSHMTRNKLEAARLVRDTCPEAALHLRKQAAVRRYAFCRVCAIQGIMDERVLEERRHIAADREALRLFSPHSRIMVQVLIVSPRAFGILSRAIDAARKLVRGGS